MSRLKIFNHGVFVTFTSVDRSTLDTIYATNCIPKSAVMVDYSNVCHGFKKEAEVFLDDCHLGSVESIIREYGSHRLDLMNSLYRVDQINIPLVTGIIDYEVLEGEVFINQIPNEYSVRSFFYQEFINHLVYEESINSFRFIDDSPFNGYHGNYTTTSNLILVDHGRMYSFPVM